jgi:hypothetical protein
MAFIEDIAVLIRKASGRGELPPGTDPHEGALVFGAFYFAGLILGLKQNTFDTKERLKVIEAQVERYFFAGKPASKKHPNPRSGGKP